MVRYKTLFLDADGTLLDFKKTEAVALRKVFSSYNIAFDETVNELYDKINQGLWRAFERGEISKETVIYSRFQKLFDQIGVKADGRAFESEYRKCLGEGADLIDGAETICQELSQCCDLYIVTNGVSKTQLRRLRLSGLDQYMKGIFVSEDAGYQKPMKEFFDYVFARIPAFKLTDAILIGDSLASDIEGGNRAGLTTCWYNPNSVENEGDRHIDFEIKNLSQLREIVNF